MSDISLGDYIPLICEVIGGGGEFRLYPRGTSMLPLLRQGKDSVALVSPSSPRRGDILLYRRADGAYVLHRLVKIRRGGELVFSGDNHMMVESGIEKESILAAVAAVYREDKRIEKKAPLGCLYRGVMVHRPCKYVFLLIRRMLRAIRT